jgi:hypothetical protein
VHSTLDAFDRATTVWTSGRTIDRTTDWTTNQQSNTTNTTLAFHHSTHDWNPWTGSGGSGGGCFEWDATPPRHPSQPAIRGTSTRPTEGYGEGNESAEEVVVVSTWHGMSSTLVLVRISCAYNYSESQSLC